MIQLVNTYIKMGCLYWTSESIQFITILNSYNIEKFKQKQKNLLTMFNKKLPLKQAPQQVYEQQYSQQSEPLIEEVDPTYQPNQKQVRQYALQTLGMKLPQDQSLLYLAREGLKAPITPNWVPYQSRNGDIYYKHNITQQKTYDHPTDVEYRKKYEQIKQKAARKNLKSISLKQNMGMQGLLPSGSKSGLGYLNNNSGLGSNYQNVSSISMAENIVQTTIDEELIGQLQKDLKQYEKRQQKEWRQFQEEAESQHNKRLKRIKEQNEEQHNRLQGKSTTKKTQSRILEQQQSKVERMIQQNEDNNLKEQLRLLVKQQQNKLSQYRAVYEEDNTIKLQKIEQELQQNYKQKCKLLEQKIQNYQVKQQQQREHRAKVLKQRRIQLQKPNNTQILKLLESTVENNLKQIKQGYNNRLKQKERELQAQLHQMKKILGVDHVQNMTILASKKQKLINLSQMKISAKKNKEMQIIDIQVNKELQAQSNRLRNKLDKQFENTVFQKKKQLQVKMQRVKQQMQRQYQQKTSKQIQQLYQSVSIEKNSYESTMNRKISQIRMKYINNISNTQKNKEMEKQDKIINRVVLQQKESQLKNKQQLIKGLQKQLELERVQWRLIMLEQELSRVVDAQKNSDGEGQVTRLLKGKAKSMGITYKSAQMTKYVQNLGELHSRYKQDKKLLTKILKAIQQTTAYNINQMRKNSQSATSGSAAMIKKYNEDVRKMRDNQDMINRYEMLLKRVQVGGNGFEENIANLRKFVNENLQYKQIGLKEELQRNNYKNTHAYNRNNQMGVTNIQELSQIEHHGNADNNKEKEKYRKGEQPYWNIGFPSTSSYSSANSSMEQALRQHSRFLSNVKNELNRKLYQVRYEYRS